MSGSSDRAAIQPLSPPPTSYQSFSPIAPPSVRLAMHTVLLSCCEPDLVGDMRRGGHVIELRGRLVVLARPRHAAVITDVRPAVVAVDHAGGIVGRDPQRMVVAMGARSCVNVRPPS